MSLGKKIARAQLANIELIKWYKLERRWRLRMTLWAVLAVAGWAWTAWLLWPRG
ncbi:MAG: hypothetical protein WCG26_00235 [Chloroflexales bacterium]